MITMDSRKLLLDNMDTSCADAAGSDTCLVILIRLAGVGKGVSVADVNLAEYSRS
jgi:hypothetical protein